MTHRILKLALLLALVGVASLAGSGCSSEAKRQRHLDRGEAYFQSREYQKAEIEFLNAARLSQTAHPLVVQRLGMIYHAQGRAIEAHQVLRRAKEMNAEDIELRYLLGTVELGMNRLDLAREEALFILGRQPNHERAAMLLADSSRTPENVAAAREKLAELGGNNPGWATHVALASLLLREEKVTEASAEAEKAAKLNAKAPEVQVLQARIARLEKQEAKAEGLLRSAMDNAPAHSPAKVQLAAMKFENNERAEAKALLDEILKETPDFMPAWNLRGKIALAENDLAECERITQTVLAWNPRSYEMRLLRARTLVLKQETAAALQEFAQLTALYPKSAEAKYETAVAHVQNGAVTEALRSLDDAIQLQPTLLPAVLLRAELKLRSGGVAEAITAMLAFLKAYPDNAQAKMILANAYSAMGELDQAATLYRELAQQFPAHPELPAYIGFIHHRQGRLEEARKSYQESLKIDPRYVAAAENLLDLEVQVKDLAAAQRVVDEQLKLYTNGAPALMLAAKLALAKGETNNATRLLREVAQKSPEASGLYTLLAQLESASGNNQNAVEQYKAALERNPQDLTAHLQLGMAYDATGDFANARKQYETVVKANPRVALAWNNLAYLLAERFNDLDAALSAASKARELQPSDPDTADTLGWIHFRRKEYPQALNLLREAAVRHSDHPEVIYHLARAEYVMGLAPEAKASFEKLIALRPHAALQEDARQRLAVLGAAPGADAVGVLEAFLKKEPNDYLAQFRLGQAYEASGAFQKAVATYERASAVNPTVADPLVRSAVLYAEMLGSVSKGLDAAKVARKAAPNDPVVAGLLGKLSLRTRDYVAAVALLQENTRSSSPEHELIYDLGLAYYSIGQFEQAADTLKQYLAHGSVQRTAEARDLQTLIEFARGNNDGATAQTLAQARLARETNDIPGLMTSGLLSERAGKFNEAVAYYDHILGLNKSFAPAQRQLALIYVESLQNNAKAVEMATKARPSFDKDVALTRALGKAAYRSGDFRLAATTLAQVTALTPSDAEAFYLLGLSYEKTEKIANARQAMNSAITAAPNSAHAEEARKALQRLSQL